VKKTGPSGMISTSRMPYPGRTWKKHYKFIFIKLCLIFYFKYVFVKQSNKKERYISLFLWARPHKDFDRRRSMAALRSKIRGERRPGVKGPFVDGQ
jgi:hypothetical protein